MITNEEIIHERQLLGGVKGGQAAAAVHRGKKQSPEQIEKLRKTRIGRVPPNKKDDGLTRGQRYYQKYKEKVKEQRRSYYQQNKEEELRRAKEYRDGHREQIREYNKKYYDDHK